ncbi:hypothetical protein [Desulfotalea psychrophila]|uniref:Rod shape-determining protein MreD n=1 Tax=Desulfotalea psychrophila (strain LSv54 / DSM 12343) TaxID=177439 RepID=Q6APB3_DESPS|nr:hypothetical protein [Desulfotalea psychrophila]CAG35811.1 unknown protein [Desulfotalea psychrophila LSv54]
MLTFFFWCLGVFVIVLQTTVLPYFLSPCNVPDLFFIFVAFCAYRFSWSSGVFLVFTIGWMLDVVCAAYMGFFPLECLLVFAVFKVLTINNPVRMVVYQLPLVALGYFFWLVLTRLAYSLLQTSYVPHGAGVALAKGSFLVFVAALPCFALYTFLYEWLERRNMWLTPPRRRPQKRF